jgi:cytoskeletal protein CcmA (bactofilin family)
MGSLSNLYISQSYQSLIQLGSNTSASANLIQLQDGLGNNLGVALNTQGDISASGDINASTLRIELDTEITGAVDINTFFTASTPGYTNSTNPYFTDVVRVIGSYPSNNDYPTINDVRVGWICNGINVTNGIVTAVSGSGTGDVYVTIAGSLPQISQPYTFRGRFSVPTRITGSLEVSNDITASNIQVNGDMFVSGTIHAYEVITTVESASVIFSSGSNVIGDSTSDTQTIVGQTTISGSLTIDGQLIHRGNVDITGSLKVSNDISSSTVSGIGNVTAYSASVQSFINNVSSSISGTINTLSQSVDSRLDYLEGPFSTSVDQRLDSLEFFSSSQEAKDLTLASYTGSVDTKFNAVGVYTSSMNLYTQSNDTRISNIENYTSSLRTAFTASGLDVTFNGNISVSGSINAYAIYTTIESSSVIYSSGSNVLGDASNDTQTLNGTVNVVNTLFVSGTEFTPFSQSVDYRLDNLEGFSSSLVATFATNADLTITASVLQGNINQKLFTSSFQTYTGSQDTKNSTLASYTGSNDTKWNNLGAQSSSFATTGSNNFIGNQTITGTLLLSSSEATELTVIGNSTFSGSVNGRVIPLTITSNTASMDCSTGNFFTLALVSGSTTRLENSNILAGETLTIQLTQPSVSFGNLVFGNGFKFPSTSPYVITTTANAIDILTFVTFGTSSLMGVSVNNLV